jgi:ParB-like chromosome segregation protein Spo0J
MTTQQLTFDDMAPSRAAFTAIAPTPPQAALTFHPIADCWRLLDGAEFAALVADIAQHGVLEPVWLYDGQILDGRNRYRACQQLGIACPTRVYDGGDPIAFVLSANEFRRHDNESQRALTATSLATLPAHRPAGSAQIKALTQAQAADKLHVSRAQVQTAKKIVDQGAPAVIEAVQAGVLTVHAAAPLTALPKADQPAALDEATRDAAGSKPTATHTQAVVERQQRQGAPLTQREQASFGHRDTKEPGGVAWCWQTILLMKRRWDQKTRDEAGFQSLCDELARYHAWEVVPPDQPYGSLEALLQAEIGDTAPQYEDREAQTQATIAVRDARWIECLIAKLMPLSVRVGIAPVGPWEMMDHPQCLAYVAAHVNGVLGQLASQSEEIAALKAQLATRALPPQAPLPQSPPKPKGKPKGKKKAKVVYGSRKEAIVATARTFPRFTCAMVTTALHEKGNYVWQHLHALVAKHMVVDGQQLGMDPATGEYVWVPATTLDTEGDH